MELFNVPVNVFYVSGSQLYSWSPFNDTHFRCLLHKLLRLVLKVSHLLLLFHMGLPKWALYGSRQGPIINPCKQSPMGPTWDYPNGPYMVPIINPCKQPPMGPTWDCPNGPYMSPSRAHHKPIWATMETEDKISWVCKSKS